MKTEKLNLKGIKNVLSRAEMRKIMAGSSGDSGCLSSGTVCCDAASSPTLCVGAPRCCSGNCGTFATPATGTFCF